MAQESTDPQEKSIMDTVLRVLEGHDAELSISALTRVMHALLVGLAADREQATKYVMMVTAHMHRNLSDVSDERFGYLKSVGDGPILFNPRGNSNAN